MNVFYESVKGFTDLPIALVAAVFGILTLKKSNKNWGIFFLLIAVAGLLGAIAHIISFSQTCKNIIWTVLYILLFECIRRASLLFANYIKQKGEKEKPFLFSAEAVCYLAALCLMFFVGDYDIYILCVFAAISLARTAIPFFRVKTLPRFSVAFVGLLVPPVLFQIFSKAIPYAVVYEHIFILAELFLAYQISSESKTQNDLLP